MDAAVLARGFPTPRMVMLNGGGRVLAEVPNGGTLPDGTHAITVRRPDLYAALRDEAERRGIRTRYGKRLTGVTHPGTGVRAAFADGSTADADVLVGADGIRSTVRRLLDPAAPGASHVGFLNTGGYARGVDVPGAPGVNYFCFGRRAFFGWVKAPDGEVWWFANPPAPREPDPEELAAVPAGLWRARLLDLFADDGIPAVDLIQATGDVFSVLAQCLRDHDDAPAALARYEQLRRGRVEKVRAQGRRNGSGKSAGPVGRSVRDLVLPIVMRRLFGYGRDPLRCMWDHHIDWDTPVTTPAPTAVAR